MRREGLAPVLKTWVLLPDKIEMNSVTADCFFRAILVII